MLEQERIGFNNEAVFIRAFQWAYGKQRRGVPITSWQQEIIKAFTEDYDKAIRKFARKGSPNDPHSENDIYQEIWLKVLNGVFGWRDRGARFTAWIAVVAQHVVADYWPEQDTIPLSSAIHSKLKNLKLASAQLQQDLGRNPTDEELATKLECSAQALRELEEQQAIIEMASIDEPFGNDASTSLAEVLPDASADSASTVSIEDQEVFRECLAAMSFKDQTVYILMCQGYSSKEIACVLGITENNVNIRRSRTRKEMEACLKDKGAIDG